MNVRKLLLVPVVAVMICSTLVAVAQKERHPDWFRRQADYYFLFQVGQSELSLSFRDNRTQLDRMMSSLGSMITDRGMRVDRIVIRASSSPEGSVALNERLWSRRADAVRNRIISAYPELLDKIHVQSQGENWAGLYEAVLEDRKVPNREQAADIIAMSSSIDARKYFLSQLNNGVTWNYIAQKVLPELRTASVAIFYSDFTADSDAGVDADAQAKEKSGVQAVTPTPTNDMFIEESHPKEPALVAVLPSGGAKPSDGATEIPKRYNQSFTASQDSLSELKGPGMALKTNILYLLALQANIETEFYFGRRWSLNLEAQVAWWSLPQKHIHYRYANFSPEFRFWSRKNGSFTGSYLGLAAGGGLYDLSLGQARNNYEGYQGEYGTVSLTYGCMWHIKKNFYIEAGFGIGYLFTEYRRYQHLDTHNVYQGTQRLQTFIPTKLKVNLVWRLGNGNIKR